MFWYFLGGLAFIYFLITGIYTYFGALGVIGWIALSIVWILLEND